LIHPSRCAEAAIYFIRIVEESGEGLMVAASILLRRWWKMFLRVLISSIVLQTLILSATAQNAHMFCLNSVQALKARGDKVVQSRSARAPENAGKPSVVDFESILFEGLTYELVAVKTEQERSSISPLRIFSSAAGQLFQLWNKFQLESSGAVFLPIFSSTQLRFSYSDIFETRAHPEKGGHGPSILFRYSFRR
jgi:hypothetical protein